MKKKSVLSLTFGFCSLIMDILGMTLGGVPMGIAFGIMGIALAFATKEEGNIAGKNKLGLILSLIGLSLGIIEYLSILSVFSMMNDPETAKKLQVFINEFLGEENKVSLEEIRKILLGR